QGTDSRWDLEETLVVGELGHGKLEITGGGAVGAKRLHLGRSAGSTGELKVEGDGSELRALGIDLSAGGAPGLSSALVGDGATVWSDTTYAGGDLSIKGPTS